MERRARLLIGAAGLAWIGRWALRELASHLGNRRRGPPAKDSARAPGYMPGPFDR